MVRFTVRGLVVKFHFQFQVWFQNRRMKDKRQRQTTPWPIDPNFLTLMVHQLAAQQNAAAQIRSNPWPFGQAYNQPAAGKFLYSYSHWQIDLIR